MLTALLLSLSLSTTPDALENTNSVVEDIQIEQNENKANTLHVAYGNRSPKIRIGYGNRSPKIRIGYGNRSPKIRIGYGNRSPKIRIGYITTTDRL